MHNAVFELPGGDKRLSVTGRKVDLVDDHSWELPLPLPLPCLPPSPSPAPAEEQPESETPPTVDEEEVTVLDYIHELLLSSIFTKSPYAEEEHAVPAEPETALAMDEEDATPLYQVTDLPPCASDYDALSMLVESF